MTQKNQKTNFYQQQYEFPIPEPPALPRGLSETSVNGFSSKGKYLNTVQTNVAQNQFLTGFISGATFMGLFGLLSLYIILESPS